MEGFLCYRLGGLIFGGAYKWRGLFSEFTVFAFKICLRHRSVMPSLSGVPPPKKNSGSAPEHLLDDIYLLSQIQSFLSGTSLTTQKHNCNLEPFFFPFEHG